ncbi:MAG: phospholipid/cholesterol/gamma-HCH transport system substrate-binding protein [Pseudonocardiales bacterium]|nr:phospholipid/cholesterol/gamma-HCH transport system substrate-binding protein [Pseudonocardiales bacterium]
MNRSGLAVAAVAASLLVSGCEFTGAGSMPLPFSAGTGAGRTQVRVEMASASNLGPNSEVKVADITVGTVTGIRFKDWQAELTVSLAPGTELPANATAMAAQKSLLGATYLELAAPTDGTATGRLRAGDVIPASRSGGYPDTEQLLAAMSVVLNGGGLNQLKTINTELNHALDGREPDVRALVDNLQGLVGTLDAQRNEIVRAIDGLNRFAGRLAEQRDTLAAALESVPQGLAVLNRNREDLTAALTAIGNLGDVANRVIDTSREDLLANLRDLRPSLGRLADAGRNLTQSLSEAATFPWPSNTLGNAFKGDYANLWITLDVTADQLQRNFLKGSPLEGLPPLGAGQEATDPLRAPLVEDLPGLAPANGPGQGDATSGSPSGPTSIPSPTSAPQGGLLAPLLGGGR